MIETPPLATPRLMEMAAPNSNAASRMRTPSGVRVMPKKPPPPKSMTVRRNGFSRVQKLKPTSRDSSTNGTLKWAPRAMFSRLKIPTARLGMPRSNPALMPSAVTSR